MSTWMLYLYWKLVHIVLLVACTGRHTKVEKYCLSDFVLKYTVNFALLFYELSPFLVL